MLTSNSACPGHPPLTNGHPSAIRPPNPFVRHSTLLGLVGLVSALLTAPAFAATPAIIPLPQQMQVRPGVFTLCPSQPIPGAPARATQKILVDGASLQTGQFLATTLFKSTGYQFVVATNGAAGPIRNAILLTTVNALSGLGAEGYELTVAPDSIVIRAPAQAGLFYGVQSLLQLFPPQILAPRPVSGVVWTAPCVYIQDQPRFAWRGVMLDVSRHFVDKQEVERILDGLALHKINTFHWHLTDDHGWRIQINSYPLLTATASTNTAAWRTGIDYGLNPAASTAWNSLGKYGGYYTQDDIREVVAYAQQRHITIVPELEFPAHCTAALVSYPSLGCGNADTTSFYNMDSIHYGFTLFSLAGPGCWTFSTNVLTEVMSLFPGQYIHCGGDEVIATGDTQWTTYSYDANQMTALGVSTGGGQPSRRQYQRWFTTNLVSFLKANGRTMGGWSEIEDAGTITNALLFEWTTDQGNLTASNGQPVVMCPNGINYYEQHDTYYYTNEPYFQVGGGPSYKSISDVYNYEPVPATLNSPWTTNIIGAQVNLWTECVPGPLNVEYKIFPRICAEAEMTWTPKAQKNLGDFTTRLATGKQRLAQMGLNYNQETNTLIGTWGPSVSSGTLSYTITPYVTKRGEIDVSFVYTSGSDGLNVYSVALLENGVQVDSNTFQAFTGTYNGTTYLQGGITVGGIVYGIPYYSLHLPEFHPGSTYTIQASVAENGTANSTNGKVFLPNWN
jgi:hexosaminidase